MKNFDCFTLSGNNLVSGIKIQNGKVSFSGGPGRPEVVLAHVKSDKGDELTELNVINIGRKENKIFLQPVETGDLEKTQTTLFLVHEYCPGSGSKRWPSFHIDWEHAGPVEILIQKSRCAGSGTDEYSLVLATSDWGNNIASQFINERDYPGQAISYALGEKKESNLPHELLIAFGGDEVKVALFIENTKNLPTEKLDEHILGSCGRGRVQNHLEEIAGPDFFLGADPNAVKSYIYNVHFSVESVNESNEHSVVDSAMRDALRKAKLIE